MTANSCARTLRALMSVTALKDLLWKEIVEAALVSYTIDLCSMFT